MGNLWRRVRQDAVQKNKKTIYGNMLHLLITLEGIILDFELAPANASKLAVGLNG